MSATPPVTVGQASILAKTSQRFSALRQRARRGICTEALAVTLVALVGYALVTYVIDRNLRLETPFRLVLLAAFAVLVGRLLRDRLVRPLGVFLDDDEMALAVERQDPTLHQALISSMQFDRALAGKAGRVSDSREMMSAVVQDVDRRLASVPFHRALDARRVRKFAGIAATGAALFLGWGLVDGQSLRLWAMRNLALSSVNWPVYTQLHFLDAAAGRIRLPQGDPYTVRVGVGGRVPDQVFLYYEFASGEDGVEQMSRTGDGDYTLTLEALLEDATLHAEGGDGSSEPLEVVIVERPRIEDLDIRIEYPAYMGKEIEVVPPTEGEIRLLRGSKVMLAGRSHKPIKSASIQIGKDNDNTTPLTVAADGHAFAGEISPKAGGLLEVNVVDQDDLGAGAPPRLLLRIVDDKPPKLDLKLRGISSLITAQAIIPGDLTVKDDFGLTRVAGGIRAVVDSVPEREPTPQAQPGEGEGEQAGGPEPVPVAELPFDKATVIYGDSLVPGSLRYETIASIDLKQFNERPDEDDAANRIRPGMLLSLRYSAEDNYGPGDPHQSFSEVLSFRVVTREKLIQELRRRQVEQRLALEQIRDDETEALLSLRDTDINPVSDHEKAAQARARFKTLARRQLSLGRRVKFVGETYQRILWEYENNRVWEPSKTREIEALTAIPLADLAKEPFPRTSREVGEFADTGNDALKASAVEGYVEILARIEAVIKVMEQTETLAALLEQLRGVIKRQEDVIRDVDQKIERAADDVFNQPGRAPGKGSGTGRPGGGGGDDRDEQRRQSGDAPRNNSGGGELPENQPRKPGGGDEDSLAPATPRDQTPR